MSNSLCWIVLATAFGFGCGCSGPAPPPHDPEAARREMEQIKQHMKREIENK